MKIEESLVPRRGNPRELEVAAAGKRGAPRKLPVNEIDALWDELQALNRAAGPWGALGLQKTA